MTCQDILGLGGIADNLCVAANVEGCRFRGAVENGEDSLALILAVSLATSIIASPVKDVPKRNRACSHG